MKFFDRFSWPAACSFPSKAAIVWADAWGREKPIPALGKDNAVGRTCRGLPDMLDSLNLDKAKPLTILEIGVELGGSTRFFLEAFPRASVVSIDPWIESYPLPKDWEYLRKYTAADGHSLYNVFRSFCWDDRHRILPIRAFSDVGVKRAYDLGIRPDLVFVDGDHRYHGVFADLVLCRTLFPDAILTGDDWTFAPTTPKYAGHARPVREAVEAFAKHFGLNVKAHRNSYVLTNP